MKSFLRSFLASLLAVLVVLLVIVGILAFKISRSDSPPDVKEHTWLVIDLYGGIDEYDPPADIMTEIMGGKPETLTRILGNLEKACVDDDIEGVIFKMSATNGAGLAMLEEIRGGIKKVRQSGKKVYGYSDSMNRKLYYLAASCDSIFMPVTGYIHFAGMATVTQHIKGTLDKLGINPNLHKIKDFKSAAEMVIRKDMSESSRRNKEWMIEEIWDMYCQALEEDRGLTKERVVEAMNRAEFMVEEAVEFGLIDRALYWDEIEEMLKLEKDKKLRTVCSGGYAKIEPGKLGLKGKKKIAVIHAQGMIGGRRNKVDPLLGLMMGHESIVAEFRRACRDKDIAAVVFRVDSGGGEALTSDMIGHAVEVTAKEKPVVVSMVDVAASGGYHIAYRATKIMADPMTITGSIGSISMKFNMSGFYEKLGITHDFVEKGPHAMMMSDLRDFTREEREIFERNHWDGFNHWLRDVCERRGMTFEEGEKLAHGRVWTGRQAKNNGLVDELGGLDRAIELAKELAEIPAEEKVSVVHYPVKKDLLETLMGGGGSFTAAARYLVYRFIREDLAETWNLVTDQKLYLVNDQVVD
ncbi:MAG: signal peptide peptidase SppA [Candidatus Krumholzibacteriota bacterium]|nr:signal peptide peptidase SppA [Candidatus Krumholzibacteriota bacterium]